MYRAYNEFTYILLRAALPAPIHIQDQGYWVQKPQGSFKNQMQKGVASRNSMNYNPPAIIVQQDYGQQCVGLETYPHCIKLALKVW